MSNLKLDPYTDKIMKNENMATIFYSDWCRYSKSSIKLLKDKHIKFKGYR